MLKRARHPMPPSVRSALVERGLLAAYRARPAYQQNDYLGWIGRARRPETRQKRLQQMLDELERGGLYMNMAWRPGRRPATRASAPRPSGSRRPGRRSTPGRRA